MNNILISEDDSIYIIPILKERVKALKDKIKTLQEEELKLTNIVENMEAGEPFTTHQEAAINEDSLESKYDSNLPWFEKAVIILKHYGSPMSGRKISEVVKQLEPHRDFNKILNSLPSVLSATVKRGKLLKVMGANKEVMFKLL